MGKSARETYTMHMAHILSRNEVVLTGTNSWNRAQRPWMVFNSYVSWPMLSCKCGWAYTCTHTHTHIIYRLIPFMLWTSGIPKSFSLISSFVAALHISRYFLLMGQQANIKVCYKFSKTTSEKHITSDGSWKRCCISMCVLECFKGFTEKCGGLGDDASSERMSTAKSLEMNWLTENW